jgi:nitroreductase
MQPHTNPKEITDSLVWRRAIKVFDTAREVSADNLHAVLEAGRLAPSAYGLEPWQFIVVENKDLREKIKTASYGQAQVTDGSHLIVIARQTNGEHIVADLLARTASAQGKTVEDLAGFKGMLDGAFAHTPEGPVRDGWLARQTYIPLGMMMSTASLMGIDNAAMEGFDAAQVNDILGLTQQNLSAQVFLVLGYRSESDTYSKSPKVRREYSDVVRVI